MGNKSAPLIGGIPLGSIISTPNLGSDDDRGRIAFYISSIQYNQLLTNGIFAYYEPPIHHSGTWIYVTPEDLESYCKRFGFKSYNFDAYKDYLSLTDDTIPYRSYSAGEKTDSVEYFKQNAVSPEFPARYYGSLRYVDLTT